MIDLYRYYDASTLHAWARRLRYFRYCVGYSSGHMEVPEELKLRLEHEGTEESFLALLRQLGIEPRPYIDDPDRLRTIDAPWPDVGYPQWQSPRYVMVAGQKVYVHGVGSRFIELTLSEGWSVSPHHVEAAEQIEALIDALSPPVRSVDPPEDSERCLSPKRHPHVWED